MKRTLLMLLCTWFTFNLNAQKADYYKENKHEVRLSLGTTPSDRYAVDGYYYNSGFYNYPNLTPSQVSYLRQPMNYGARKSSGAIALTYFYHAPWINGRFTFGGSLAYNKLWRDNKHSITGFKMGEQRESTIAITPMIRYAWIAKPIFQVYSGIGASIYREEYKYKEQLTPEMEQRKTSYDGWEASFMLTLAGVSVGKRVFGFGEFNIGGRMGEFVGGVGYRF